jgi:hypothetical protein
VSQLASYARLRNRTRDAAYVELGVALRARLEGLLASLSLGLGLFGSSAGPAAGDGGGAQARGGAEGGAGDNGRHCVGVARGVGCWWVARASAKLRDHGRRQSSGSRAWRRVAECGLAPTGKPSVQAQATCALIDLPPRHARPLSAPDAFISFHFLSLPHTALAHPPKYPHPRPPAARALALSSRSFALPPPLAPSVTLSPRPSLPCHEEHAYDATHHRHPPPMTTPTEQKRSSTGSRVLGMTGPVGEPSLPPSRPSSIITAHSGSQAPGQRRGHHSLTGSFSRPTTSTSRTHVPLAAHGFFRPMSSQRLQQQRNQRPTSLLHGGHGSVHETADGAGSINRQSIGSYGTLRHAPTLGLHHEHEHEHVPPSRGTDMTDRDMPDRTTANSTPTGAETVRSRDESITPLQKPRPERLNLANSRPSDNGKGPAPGSSSRSFRSSFMMSSRDGRSTHLRQQGHEKLTSAESSPRLPRSEVTKQLVKNEMGKNYQYFTGNTAFCWGGRLQNTRDRPVNIATAIMIILPAALFFGFSYVSCSSPLVSRANKLC